MLALLLMALNATGSVGDLIMPHKLSRHDRSVLFQDAVDGYTWYEQTTSG